MVVELFLGVELLFICNVCMYSNWRVYATIKCNRNR